MPASVCVVYYSGFKGATARLSERLAHGAQSVPGTTTRLIRVEDIDDAWEALHAADAIVFGSPTYVGSVAARFKEFIEMCAGQVWLERLWLNKLAGGFTTSAGRSGDKLNCLQDLTIFAAQMGMIWVPMRIVGGNYSTYGSENDLNRMAGYLGVMAQANIDQPAELAPPESDLATAEIHGHHIATIAAQLAVGRAAVPASYIVERESETPQGRPRSLLEIGQ